MAHPEDREEGCTLRIFHLNDVYLLDNFPRIKTLIQTKRTKNTITTLAGDFVSPSLLSRLGQNLTPGSLVVIQNAELYFVLPLF